MLTIDLLATRIRMAMAEMHLSQDAVARATELSPTTISRLCNARCELPGARVIMALAECFNCDPAELVGNTSVFDPHPSRRSVAELTGNMHNNFQPPDGLHAVSFPLCISPRDTAHLGVEHDYDGLPSAVEIRAGATLNRQPRRTDAKDRGALKCANGVHG